MAILQLDYRDLDAAASLPGRDPILDAAHVAAAAALGDDLDLLSPRSADGKRSGAGQLAGGIPVGTSTCRERERQEPNLRHCTLRPGQISFDHGEDIRRSR